MDRTTLANLRRRYGAGERITRLAKEAGVSWQWLHGQLVKPGNTRIPEGA